MTTENLRSFRPRATRACFRPERPPSNGHSRQWDADEHAPRAAPQRAGQCHGRRRRDCAPATAPAGAPAIVERVAKGHKIATAPIAVGEPIRKFGQIIGFASKPIAPGEWVHEHNCVVQRIRPRLRLQRGRAARVAILPVERQATFQGFRRANGKAGTRNYLGILTSVNCSATVARYVAREVERSGILDDYPNVDGVISLVHGTGCGMAAKGEGFDVLKRTQWGYAANPNMGGVVMVGLGCEVFQIGRMKEEYGLNESDLFHTMTIQATGGTRKTIEAGVERDQGDAADPQRAPSARRCRRAN